MVFSYSTETSI